MNKKMLLIVAILLLSNAVLAIYAINTLKHKESAHPPASVPVTINGQMFIVLQSGLNVPLGGIPVYLVDEMEFQISIKRTARYMLARMEPIIKEMLNDTKESEIKYASYKNTNSKKAHDEWSKIIDKLKYRIKIINQFGRSIDYAKNLDIGRQITQTDSTGNFSIILKPSDLGSRIVACATRKLYDSTENYCWFVSTKGNVLDTKLLLNNNNMFENFQPNSRFAFSMPDLSSCNRYSLS